MTLDRCVQRLRRRLIQESWQKQQGAGMETTGRVPSFFTSPSLTNMGGLSVTDQPAMVEGAPAIRVGSNASNHRSDSANATSGTGSNPQMIPLVDVNSGWGGMGLRETDLLVICIVRLRMPRGCLLTTKTLPLVVVLLRQLR